MKKVPGPTITQKRLRKRLAQVGALERKLLDLEALRMRVAKAERLTAPRVPDFRADAIDVPTPAPLQ